MLFFDYNFFCILMHKPVGTVINHRIVNLETRLDLKQEYNELVVNSSYPSNTDSVQLRLETASEELAEKLNIAPGAKIIACEKRVLAGKNPAKKVVANENPAAII